MHVLDNLEGKKSFWTICKEINHFFLKEIIEH